MHGLRTTRPGCLLLGALVLAGLGGCGAPAVSRSVPASGVPTISGVTPSLKHYDLDFVALTINQLVAVAESAVIARVTQVGPLRWNSESGEPWGLAPQDAGAVPLTMRDLSVQVEEVVFARDRTAAAGQVLIVRQQGPAVISQPGSADALHNLAATSATAVGDRLLLLLAEHPLPLQSQRLLPGLEPVNGYQSVWQLHDATAVSADPQRTVPLANLLARIRLEHDRGDQPYTPGDTTAGNPLAPPAPVPAPLSPVPCIGSDCGQ